MVCSVFAALQVAVGGVRRAAPAVWSPVEVKAIMLSDQQWPFDDVRALVASTEGTGCSLIE